MTTKQEIDINVSLDCKYISSDIKTHIFNQVCIDLLETCSIEYGYILGVNKITKFKDNYISNATSLTIFTVTVEIITLKPYTGQITEGKVRLIFEQGVFIEILDKLKVLIPAAYLTGFKWNPSEETFIKESNNCCINEKDVLKVEIVKIKYERKEYSCIGKII